MIEESAAQQTPSTLESSGHERGEARESIATPAVDLHGVEERQIAELMKRAGRLTIRAVDSETGRPLDGLHVRAATATRLADRQSSPGQAQVDFILTPGSYSAVLLSPGYEAVELQPVQVTQGATVSPDVIRMNAGAARLNVSVAGDRSPARALRLELLGEGRHPCPKCAGTDDSSSLAASDRLRAWSRFEPCAACGYMAKATRVALPPNGYLSFEGLVSGSFALRLIDVADRTVGIPKFLELRRSESCSVVLDAPAPRSLHVELLDTDGASLASEWAGRLRARQDEERVKLFTADPAMLRVQFECSFQVDGMLSASSTLRPPRPPSLESFVLHQSPFAGRRLGRGGGSPVRTPSIDDHPRASSEPLAPASQPLVIEPADLPSKVDEDGLAQFGPLPTSEMTVSMKCGPFIATFVVPASTEDARVTARLTKRVAEVAQGTVDSTSDPGTFLEYEAGGRR